MKSRYPAIRKNADGTIVCRGCGGDIPKGRQTWCSNPCYDTYCPERVIFAVKQRDKGICQICLGSIAQMLKEWKESAPLDFFEKYSTHPRPVGLDGHHWTSQEWKFVAAEWKAYKQNKPSAEYDHIVPFSEGGDTVLENMRLVCANCHKKRTAEWRASRRKNKSEDLLDFT